MKFHKNSNTNLSGTVELQHSIGFELLTRVFSIYFIVALTVTVGHILLTYQDAQNKIIGAFADLNNVFSPGIAQSLWEINELQVKSIMKGMMNMPVIKGVKIEDTLGNILSEGLILNDDNTPVIIDMEGDKVVVESPSFLQRIISQRFQLTYVEENEKYKAGFITLYSDNNYAFDQVKYEFLIIIINSIIKTAALWYIFLWFAKRRLSHPLALLTAATQQLHLDALDKIVIDTKIEKRNELKILEEGFDEMVQKLIRARESLKELNRTLESQVVQRTLELQETLEELNDQHTQLKQTQTNLVQSEKMASLGTLVAGVAHEVNNPVNFIHINTSNLKNELKKHQTTLNDILEEEQELLEYFEPKFASFFEMLEEMHQGSTRIKTIVSDLRAFSHLDEAEYKQVNIVEGIKSTLRLLTTQYKETVRFVCDFQAEPKLECWPAQLNQVFMHIMVNACQAILNKQEKSGIPTPGTLTFRTFFQENRKGSSQLAINFHDTGCGMSEEVKKKIFDPFFTTKPVGEGSGMGMSIAFGIIEKHQGSIEVESTSEEGTSITVFLPLNL